MPLVEIQELPIALPQNTGTGGGGVPISTTHELMVSLVDLPSADPSVPLLRWRLKRAIDFTGSGVGVADASIAATAPSSLRLRKNGGANGTIAFTGTTGVISFTNSSYADGDLFELYPPAAIDATLDDVSITFETD